MKDHRYKCIQINEMFQEKNEFNDPLLDFLGEGFTGPRGRELNQQMTAMVTQKQRYILTGLDDGCRGTRCDRWVCLKATVPKNLTASCRFERNGLRFKFINYYFCQC